MRPDSAIPGPFTNPVVLLERHRLGRCAVVYPIPTRAPRHLIKAGGAAIEASLFPDSGDTGDERGSPGAAEKRRAR